MTKGRSLGLLAALLAGTLLFTALAGTDVDAARGGKGGGRGGKGSTTTAQLWVTPNPVPYGTDITINGSGFKAGETVLLNTSHLPTPQTTADASGNFSFVYDYTYGCGNAGVQAYVQSGSSWVMVAYASFTVC